MFSYLNILQKESETNVKELKLKKNTYAQWFGECNDTEIMQSPGTKLL